MSLKVISYYHFSNKDHKYRPKQETLKRLETKILQ